VNLTYVDGSASDIHLGGTGYGAFNFDTNGALLNGDLLRDSQLVLTLNGDDQDYLAGSGGSWTALIDNMLSIRGSDMGTAFGDDRLVFASSSSDNLAALHDTTSDDFADLTAFLIDANTVLDGNATRFTFGTVDGKGYLAYDDDGDGISALVEFYGMATFDWARLEAGTSAQLD
jgi:hypothetical protein